MKIFDAEMFVADTSLRDFSQLIYLDFDGAEAVYSNDELNLAVDAVVADSGFTAAQQQNILAALNAAFKDAAVVFVNEKPANGLYSTIYVGSSDAFAAYGDFAGISETVDAGNAVKNDNAFAFVSAADGEAAAISVIAHEAGHLLGEAHAVKAGDISDFAAVVPVESFTTFVEGKQILRHSAAGIVSVIANGTVKTLGELDSSKWTLAGTGNILSPTAPSALWVENATGTVYVQESFNSVNDVVAKKNVMGVVGPGYSLAATGDFLGTGMDGALLLSPAFGDETISANYGFAVWAKESDGSLTNGWLGALVNTWQETGALNKLKGNYKTLAGEERLKVINANNYQYEFMGVADFNGDGKDDVVLRNCMPKTVEGETITGSGDVFVFLTDSRANVIAGNRPAEGIIYAGCATDGWDIVGYGDFDNDGCDDMLLSDGQSLAGWKMVGGARVDNLWFGGIGSDYEYCGVADVNSDGCDDIVFRHGQSYEAWTVANGAVSGAIKIS